ncbi:MAG TPA: DUF692 domain-containing protein [Anaeromyxobacteraceae bacterium]|nr:DUF692 domain-containing protein [Anaeromyxobacteraceae bacterium]
MAFQRLDLGHGIGLRTKHFPQFDSEPSPADWVEVVTENFMAEGGRPIALLEKVRRDTPVVLHGVSLSIGSTDPLSARYLDDLDRLVARIEPAMVTDHLCWGTWRGRYVHDLLPLPYTEETLAHVSSRVASLQDRLGRQILLENPSSYMAYRDSTMTEWEFLAALSLRADCGILLDVNNVYVSANNLGFDPIEYLNGIPPDRVGQFHLAGHSDKGNYLLDTHDAPVPPPVWELYREALRRFGRVPTLVEWDDRIPPLVELVAESRHAEDVEMEELGSVLRSLAS